MLMTVAVVLCLGDAALPRSVFSPDSGASYYFNVRGCTNVRDQDANWLLQHGYVLGKEGEGEPDVITPPMDYSR